MNLELLGRLSETFAVPSREERVRELVRAELAGLVGDIREDALGNLIAVKRGTGPRSVMISAHMDEIGFIVKFIDKDGFLRVQQLGGFDARNLFARNVVVCTAGGDLPGILHPSGKPVHLSTEEERKKIPEIKEFMVDLGLPADEVKRLVRIGDPVALEQTFRTVGHFLVGKALDDRVSVWVLIEVLRALRDVPHEWTIHAVFSTQEEVGLRGAIPAAFGLEPDIGIALDTTIAADTPGVPEDEAVCRSGAGVGIKIMDGASLSAPHLVREFIALAERNAIAYQLEVLPLGGTDAAGIQRSRAGVPVITLSTPSRYVHTVQEAVHRDDLAATLALLLAWLKD